MTSEPSAMEALLKAKDAEHKADLALSEIRGHERLCVERSDRQLADIAALGKAVEKNQEITTKTTEAQTLYLQNQLQHLHNRISGNRTWSVAFILSCSGSVIAALAGACWYLGDKLVTLGLLNGGVPPAP